jgi:NAD+ synthase (glutamine-hydrolysing)
VKIALAQLNPTVGDVSGNADLVRSAAREAARGGADLLVVSELAISGYPPKDLLLREGFVCACDHAVEELAVSVDQNLGVVVGHPTHRDVPEGRLANAASFLHGGMIQSTIHKSLLPNYDVFDEERYFKHAAKTKPVPFCGRQLGIHICEDAWWGEPNTFYHEEPLPRPDPILELVSAGADVLINLSSSPFEISKPNLRSGIIQRQADRSGLPFVFVNQVGGNDDLVFDGRSMVFDQTGKKVLQLAGFQTNFQIVDLTRLPDPVEQPVSHREADLLDALVLGLRDYMQKCGFRDCVLGLSGGIDSTLACYIATEALGANHVHGLLMPSRYSSEHSIADARQLAETLNIDYEIIPIDDVHQSYEAARVVGDDLAGDRAGLADQNLQARIRGAMVMIRSNRHGWLALATGNKSELAVGYCTLYGDMVGGFAVLSDVFKQDVYAVSRYINEVRERREVIPANVLTKAPSAELAPDQFDQDVLPPYELLDSILEGLVEREESVASLSKQFPPETVQWVANRLDRNEFKRRQLPPGIKLSQRAFGSGRRMPMAAKFDAF